MISSVDAAEGIGRTQGRQQLAVLQGHHVGFGVEVKIDTVGGAYPSMVELPDSLAFFV